MGDIPQLPWEGHPVWDDALIWHRPMSPPSVPAPRQVVRVADIPMEELLSKFPVDPHRAENPLSPAGLAVSGRAAPPFRGAMALGKIAAQRDIALSRLFLTFGADTPHCSLAAQASKTTGWPALQSWTDALSTKSASTLVARSLALARYAEFCQQHDVPLLPFDEVLVYKFPPFSCPQLAVHGGHAMDGY